MQLIMLKNKNRYFWLLLALLIVAPAINIYADGSKDIYPSGILGYRAFLRSTSSATASATVNWPFANRGTHYVFARVGERIALASSAQTGTNSRILLYEPTGTSITLSYASGEGNIANRNAELAGPLLYNESPSGNKYKPIYHLVQTEGIYRVEFLAPGTSDPSGTVLANSNWGTTNNNNAGIAAWEVSVINTSNSTFISGRVYTNVLNLSVGTSNATSDGFYGLVYVRTKDGYTYRVNNNGSNGMYFTFFVNNNGFVDVATQLPIYKSLNNSTIASLTGRVQNPNNADTGTHLTHKMFYTLPDINLPDNAQVAVTSNGGAGASGWSADSTWLKRTPVVPDVTTPVLRGVDGRIGQVSNKGGYIEFTADVQGNYRIEIISTGSPSFPTRTIIGQASAGLNKVLWDGKDGANNPLPAGTVPAKVTVQLQGAEVHFPFFDVEYNSTGIIIELLKHASLPVIDPASDIVYWNDIDVTSSNPSNPKNNSHLPPANSTGISSNLNGHKWGNNFGNEKSIDTWTFITGEKKQAEADVTVKIADLEVVSVISDKENIVIGEDVEYTVTVKNNGPSDVEDAPFTFRLPPGFEPVGVPVFSGNSCGTEAVEIEYDLATRTYWSKLDLPNGCEITYTFMTTVTGSSDPSNTEAKAGILRPDDVTDPDATNKTDPAKIEFKLPTGRTWEDLWKYPDQWPKGSALDTTYIRPFSAEFECANRPDSVIALGPCNNIKDKSVALQRRSDLAINKAVDISSPNVGDPVTFRLRVTNLGPHVAKSIVITDTVPAGYTIGTINNGGIRSGNVITWTRPELDVYPQDSIVVTFTATVNSPGPYVNIAVVSGDVVDPNPDNNRDTATASPGSNYWHGTVSNEWKNGANWTGGWVPVAGQDVVFATQDNNPFDPSNPSSGTARRDLHLDDVDQPYTSGGSDNSGGRIIGNLENNSGRNLVITEGNQLIINEKVLDSQPDSGTIVVKAAPDKPSGTLEFTKPLDNKNVGAIVEFYNKAYDCDTCGTYRRSWQYFGVPVKSAAFPYGHIVEDEEVNLWTEPYNGDKWRPVPTATPLEAFKGYQITNSSTTKPTGVYSFTGTLNVGDTTVALTKTASVNYAGANLVANSYTAAIPINDEALIFPTAGVHKTLYLFNTGTRDQWRKLNGTIHNPDGFRSGQYLAVPLNLGGAGTAHFPDKIPSMHSFMVLFEDSALPTGGSPLQLEIKYNKLVKNTEVKSGDGSTTIVTRSAGTGSASPSSIPSLVMDVIGGQSADRVWIFAREGTTYGFDNGWDARKMPESGIAQFYVADDADKDRFQVATVPGLDNVTLGFVADVDGKYTVEFALSDYWATEEIYLYDLATSTKERVKNGGSYTFEAKKGDAGLRFRLSYSGNGIPTDDESAKIAVNVGSDGKIVISNNSNNDCTVFISNTAGKVLQKLEVKTKAETVVENISRGNYVVRLQNAVVNDARKVVIE